MTNYIPEEKISEVRNSADIVEVVSESVLLKKTGNNYIGLCPFHSEKTPSFTVSPDKQIFHCFGCGVGGNVFTYLMKQEGLSFPEAVRAMARRYGIEVPDKRMSPGQKKQLDEREQLYAVNRTALDYYSRVLTDTPAGAKARAYLKRRRFNTGIADEFKLGYAPGGWDNIINHLKSKGIRPVLMEMSGLVIPRKNSSGHYDRFRDRVIFPIVDTNMRVTGFGGRVMDDSLPKYLNSPETPVYHKSKSLYGLHRAKKPCRELGTVYIVEGYFDLLALHQHGITNSVATLGTALTPEHVRILRGCIGEKGRVILVYDSDEAGINAARRSISVFDKEYVNAQILILKSGYDPDAYIFEFGAEAFNKSVEHALGVIPFLLETAVRVHGLSVEGKVRVVADLQPSLATITDSVEKSLYVREIAERLGIDENALMTKVRETASSGSRLKVGDEVDRINKDRPANGSRIERQILSMMLQYPVIMPQIRQMGVITYFEDDVLRSVAKTVMEVYPPLEADQSDGQGNRVQSEEALRVAEVMDKVEDDQKRQLIAELTNWDEAWTNDGCLRVIQRFVNLSQKRRATQGFDAQIQAAIKANDHALRDKLLKEKLDVAVESDKRKMAMLRKF